MPSLRQALEGSGSAAREARQVSLRGRSGRPTLVIWLAKDVGRAGIFLLVFTPAVAAFRLVLAVVAVNNAVARSWQDAAGNNAAHQRRRNR